MDVQIDTKSRESVRDRSRWRGEPEEYQTVNVIGDTETDDVNDAKETDRLRKSRVLSTVK